MNIEIESTLPPISGELAPLLRCSAFLAYARSLGCEPDARFLLLATDYAIFYSAVKRQENQQKPNSTAASEQQQSQKHAGMLAQLNAYATAMRATFFSNGQAEDGGSVGCGDSNPSSPGAVSTSGDTLASGVSSGADAFSSAAGATIVRNCGERNVRLSLLRHSAPSMHRFMGMAMTNSETRRVALHAAADALQRSPLPRPAPPSLFRPAFLIVESHLLGVIVPLFDEKLVRNVRSRIIPAAVCVLSLIAVIVFYAVIFAPGTPDSQAVVAEASAAKDAEARREIQRRHRMLRLLLCPLFFLASLAYGQAMTRFSAVKHWYRGLRESKSSGSGGGLFSDTSSITGAKMLDLDDWGTWGSEGLKMSPGGDASESGNGGGGGGDSRFFAETGLTEGGGEAAGSGGGGGSGGGNGVRARGSSFASSPSACANCPMLRGRAAVLRKALALSQLLSSVLFTVCMTLVLTFLLP